MKLEDFKNEPFNIYRYDDNLYIILDAEIKSDRIEARAFCLTQTDNWSKEHWIVLDNLEPILDHENFYSKYNIDIERECKADDYKSAREPNNVEKLLASISKDCISIEVSSYQYNFSNAEIKRLEKLGFKVNSYSTPYDTTYRIESK
jgi:hypothetical protein